MRRIQSLFKTLLMLIPMTAVPVMAIFGIPQFFPVSASPSAREGESSRSGRSFERRVGQSDALIVRDISTERASSIDLFQPYGAGANAVQTGNAGVAANVSSSELARRRLAWKDPLAGLREPSTVSVRSTSSDSLRREVRPLENNGNDRRFDAADRLNDTSSFSGQAGIPPQGELLLASHSTDSAADTGDGTSERSAYPPDSSAQPAFDSDYSARYSRSTSGGRTRSVSPRPVQAETLSWQQAVDRLNELGIRTFRLTPDSGQSGYRFVCLVTSIDDPRISRRFEAESADPLTAVGEVLAQVENWNLHQ